ncbi:MAG: hypothetical protein WCW04_02695 [Candidatus Paceibacterota bacterium]
MKKILSYILITLILSANFLAPISVGFSGKNIEIKRNITEAYDAKLAATFTNTDTVIAGTIKVNEGAETYNASVGGSVLLILQLSLTEDSSGDILGFDGKKTAYPKEVVVTWKDMQGDGQKFEYNGLNPLGEYTFSAVVVEKTTTSTESYSDSVEKDIAGMPPLSIALNKKGDQTVVDAGKTEVEVASPKNALPGCGVTGNNTIMGCVVQGFYYILFVPTSYLFALAGTAFDYTFAYSVQDTSYKSAFVVQGWGLIRDLCNMFFIFIMLYVAIGTTLSLHSMKTKETIVNVVIIGLFINFSLFATQLIIDASNITARVFYNSNAITITEKDANGVTNATPGLKVGEGGIIPLSAALVNKVNPQNLIFSADKINSIQNNTGSTISEDTSSKGLGIGQFILIIIMASAVNIVGFTVFLTIALLFIARVIGLWLAMILSPLAFFTYILPEMAGTKMIGWKNWWPDTLKMAFLAPVFIFFMYIILKFLQADLISDIASKSLSGDGLGYFVAILVPFAFIMILMIKAKKIAVDMSGEFGEMATKAGSALGGMALGGAVGAGAFAMRGTIGALGDKVANNDWLKTHGGRLGNLARDAGKWTASKSFDARNTKLGGDAMKGMGVDAGKAKEGGYAKHKAEITEKRRERAESKKLGNNTPEVQQLHKSEEDLANLKNTAKNDTDRIDGTLAAKRLVASDASQKLTSANAKLARAEKDAENLDKDPNATQTQKDAAKAEIAKAQIEAKAAQDYFDTNAKTIADLTQERIELNSGTGRHWDKTSDGKVHEITYNKFKEDAENKKASVESMETNLDTDIQAAKDKVTNDIAQSEAELNKLKQALADETAIANPASPQDMALLQKTKDEVAKAEASFNTLNNSKDAAMTAAESEVKAALEKAKTENVAAQKTFGDIEKARAAKGFSDSNPDKQRSLDGLSLKIIPHEHHHVEEINAGRVNKYAETIRGRWFNKEANDVAAHEAIMRSEIKKH